MLKVTSDGNRVVFVKMVKLYPEQDERRGDKGQGGGWHVRIDHGYVTRVFSGKAESGRRVKQRPVRPVSLNPLRTGQPAERTMDDDHSIKDEAAEAEDT